MDQPFQEVAVGNLGMGTSQIRNPLLAQNQSSLSMILKLDN